MKLTRPDSIRENEKEFIDTINAELDWEAIEKLLFEKHQFMLQDEITYKDGDLVIHDNQIAYRFDFDIKVPLSVIFNRSGECLDIKSHRDETTDSQPPSGESAAADTLKKTASNIAEMISEINEDDA